MSSDADEPISGEIVPADAAVGPAQNAEPDPLASLIGGGLDAGGPGGGLDLGAMMQMASEMQQQVADSQEALASAELVGAAGGGAVTVTLNGHLHLVGIQIDPTAFDPDDPSMLEDLIRAAWQAAYDQVAQLQAQADPLGGLGGGLGGLFGGG